MLNFPVFERHEIEMMLKPQFQLMVKEQGLGIVTTNRLLATVIALMEKEGARETKKTFEDIFPGEMSWLSRTKA